MNWFTNICYNAYIYIYKGYCKHLMLTFLMSITKDEHKHILWHIYDNYRFDMLKMALSVIHDYSHAEDVVQTTFERIINKMHLIDRIPCDRLKSYVLLMVKSVAINLSIKEDKYKLEADVNCEEYENSNSNVEDIVIINEQVSVIRKCLNNMDDKYTHPMILRYYYGFSDSETAELLSINSASTVRSLCYRGKKMMIKAMRNGSDLNE